MELTPEERRRIYEEEKARIEAEEARKNCETLPAPIPPSPASSSESGKPVPNSPMTYIVLSILLVILVLYVLGVLAGVNFQTTATDANASDQNVAASPAPSIPETSTPSATPSAPADNPSVNTLSPEEQSALDTEEQKAKVVVAHDWKWTRESEDFDYIRGSVKNGSDRTVRYWKVVANYYDKNGEIIDSEYTNALETLLPGASKHFEIMHHHLPEAKKANVHVEEVSFEE